MIKFKTCRKSNPNPRPRPRPRPRPLQVDQVHSWHSCTLTFTLFSPIFHRPLSSTYNPSIHPLIHPFIHTLSLRTDGNNDDDDDAEIAQAAADQLNSDMDEGQDPDTDGMCVLRIKRIAALGGMEVLARLVQHGSPQVRVCVYLVDGLVGWVGGVCW